MKIAKIYIKGFQQFQDVELDFTDLETGQPAEKICFIGSNGTGKSTLLNLLYSFIQGDFFLPKQYIGSALYITGVNDGKAYNFIYFGQHGLFVHPNHSAISDFAILSSQDFLDKYQELINQGKFANLSWEKALEDQLVGLYFTAKTKSSLIYSPSESDENNYFSIEDVPQTSLNEALMIKAEIMVKHLVSHATIKDFWKILIYYIKKREEERELYETSEQNINKTKAQLIDEFDKISPRILDDLGKIWDRILNKAGLKFDSRGARNPIQLTDNLKAYVKLLKQDKIIPYKELSTGIRNYIFRIGHIFSIYYNKDIDRGLLLIDEPENSLYPDFLFELVEIYQEIVKDKRGQNNTQMFFATHNPIIAAQFKPHERIILDWNEDGSVSARKGISPEGDDPNDILSNDFELKNLLGPEGRKMWEQYINLKKKLIKTSDENEKSKLIHEIEKIGSLYNFS